MGRGWWRMNARSWSGPGQKLFSYFCGDSLKRGHLKGTTSPEKTTGQGTQSGAWGPMFGNNILIPRNRAERRSSQSGHMPTPLPKLGRTGEGMLRGAVEARNTGKFTGNRLRRLSSRVKEPREVWE